MKAFQKRAKNCKPRKTRSDKGHSRKIQKKLF